MAAVPPSAALHLPVICPAIGNSVKYPQAPLRNPPSIEDVAAGIYLFQEIYASRSESPSTALPKATTSLRLMKCESVFRTETEAVATILLK